MTQEYAHHTLPSTKGLYLCFALLKQSGCWSFLLCQMCSFNCWYYSILHLEDSLRHMSTYFKSLEFVALRRFHLLYHRCRSCWFILLVAIRNLAWWFRWLISSLVYHWIERNEFDSIDQLKLQMFQQASLLIHQRAQDNFPWQALLRSTL